MDLAGSVEEELIKVKKPTAKMFTSCSFSRLTPRSDTMEEAIYRKLCRSDPKLAWELCRDSVGMQLLGPEGITIPTIGDDSYDFEVFGVIVKDCSNTYKLLGTMDKLVTCRTNKASFKQRPMAVCPRVNPTYTYYCHDIKGHDGVKKEITIKVLNTDGWYVSMCDKDQWQMDMTNPHLQGVKSIYLINELYYANRFEIHTCIGRPVEGRGGFEEDIKRFYTDQTIPFAYKVMRYQLNCNGSIGCQEPLDCHSMNSAKWRECDQDTSLRRVPSWANTHRDIPLPRTPPRR